MGETSSLTECIHLHYSYRLTLVSYNSKTSKCYSFDSETTLKMEYLTADNEEKDNWETYINPYHGLSMFMFYFLNNG